MGLRVGIDVGGTFTDFVSFNEDTGEISHLKVLTTPREPVKGIMNALSQGVDDLSRTSVLIHASTLGTNMFLGQKGLEPPKTALITNRGFRDIIEIGRQNRPELYNLFFQRPRPLVPRNLRVGVKSRINAEGEVVEELDEDEIREWAEKLCSDNVRVFAISFLHSYRNPVHELRTLEIIHSVCPDAIAVASHRVDPQPMEYERTSTTVVNAVLMPVLGSYLRRLEESLRNAGFYGRLLIMQSSGGVSDVSEALEKPAMFIESGPSAGAVAVAYFSRMLGIDKALGFDMGGTTAKASSIIGGEPEITTVYEVGGRVHMGRRVRGSGYPVRFPYIDLAEVSAGGGTIAWIDRGGALRVGPISAGADPGPACYGLGGREPTITDANLLLGRLPEVLAGGRLRLSRRLAEEAVGRLARRLGLSLVETAWSIVKLANTVMSRALRLVSVEKGHDPREFSMFAFGGAGPLHAVELGEELGVRDVVIPPLPGVFSALGLLVTDYKHSFTKPIVRRADEVGDDELEDAFRELEEAADRVLEREGVPRERRIYRRFAEARYWGQGYTLLVPYRGSVARLVEDFHKLHEIRYGFSSREEPVVIVVVRVEAIGLTEKPRLSSGGESRIAPREAEPAGEREVFFESGWHRASVYKPSQLETGIVFRGPGIVELPDSTIVIPPGYKGVVDRYSTIVVSRV